MSSPVSSDEIEISLPLLTRCSLSHDELSPRACARTTSIYRAPPPNQENRGDKSEVRRKSRPACSGVSLSGRRRMHTGTHKGVKCLKVDRAKHRSGTELHLPSLEGIHLQISEVEFRIQIIGSAKQMQKRHEGGGGPFIKANMTLSTTHMSYKSVVCGPPMAMDDGHTMTVTVASDSESFVHAPRSPQYVVEKCRNGVKMGGRVQNASSEVGADLPSCTGVQKTTFCPCVPVVAANDATGGVDYLQDMLEVNIW
ncbi:hypothetical protein EDB87DRAFT_1581769 [Lactarius vividus]|nr:hypothetical protein EDB87DRAFT_1581769 [Lactarius vividus]